MRHAAAILAIVLAIVTAYAAFSVFHTHQGRGSSTNAVEPVGHMFGASPTRRTSTIRSAHYVVVSSATQAQTGAVVDAVESLYAEYMEFFSLDPGIASGLQLQLYRDRDEFKAHNRSKPWAEAYYQTPACHAYYADDGANPYHWMLHEATHQLNREVSRLPKSKWIDEGLASYFGSSRIDDGRLRAGRIDPGAYPIWWVRKWPLSGDIEQDVSLHRIIPLRSLISGKGGIGIDQAVNAYYIGYWSLTHFLLHARQGHYADRYRRVIAMGGTLEAFEDIIGPIDQIEKEWYAYLLRQASILNNNDPADRQ